MESNTDILRARLRQLCKENGLSPSGLSIKAGLGKGAVSDILDNPDRHPRRRTLEKIARALDVAPDYLRGQTDQRSGIEPGDEGGLGDPRNSDLTHEINRIILAAIDDDRALRQVFLEAGVPPLGIPKGATAILTTASNGETGDLVVASHSGALRVCYLVEPYLVSIEPDGSLCHFLHDSTVEVLGVIEFVGKGYASRGS